jgi:manganese transport protein
VHHEPVQQPVELSQPQPYRRVAVALDFSGNEQGFLRESLRFIDKATTKLILLHVVESPVARAFGSEGEDREMQTDRQRLEQLATTLEKQGIAAEWRLGAGDPVSQLAKLINELNVELVIVGSHGHSGVSDLIHGTVINELRHHVQVPVVIIPLNKPGPAAEPAE